MEATNHRIHVVSLFFSNYFGDREGRKSQSIYSSLLNQGLLCLKTFSLFSLQTGTGSAPQIEIVPSTKRSVSSLIVAHVPWVTVSAGLVAGTSAECVWVSRSHVSFSVVVH